MKKTQLTYTLFGIGFGFSFPILAIVADFFIFNDVPLNQVAIFERLNVNPIHYIIFMAPLVLGFTFYRIGKSIEKSKGLMLRLKRSNNAIKESNELLDAFNSHVSHDLKTVLNNQLILSTMLVKYLKEENYEKVKEISEKLQDVGENGLKTVASFLKIGEEGFVHASENSIEVEPEINRIIEENGLQDQLKIVIGAREFNQIEINAKVFESVILNIISNAIKYADDDPVVQIDLKAEEEAKKIIISDNGIGMDLIASGHQLFKPFQRIKNNLNKEGNGIGLYLVKKMMLAAGGEITVKSELNKGTSFTLVFYDNLNA